MTASPHLRGIVIAGALAVLALALGFVTLGMNQTASKAAVHTVLPLKDRHHAKAPAKHAKPVDKNLQAALTAGLPLPVARALAKKPVVVIELTSAVDAVAQLAAAEAHAGATLGGAAFVEVNVDRDGDIVSKLARALGQLPSAPAAVVYQRPASAYVTLTGFNDRTSVEQAAQNALSSLRSQNAASTGSATTPVTPAVPTTPAATVPAVATQTGSA